MHDTHDIRDTYDIHDARDIHDITVVALGPGDPDLLTLGALRALETAPRVLLRTARHGCAQLLSERGIAYQALDALYDAAGDFDALARSLAGAVLQAAQAGPLCYAVPELGEDSVRALLETAPGHVRLLPGVASGAALRAHAPEGCVCVPASAWQTLVPDPRLPLLITELDTRALACELKLKLLTAYPPEHALILRMGERASETRPLYELDRLVQYGHRLCVLVPACALERLGSYDLRHLYEVMLRLRAPDGCPWDAKQTHESLRKYLLEECYEAIDAIDARDMDALCDELGDVLLQVVFHAVVAEQHGEFALGDVTTAIVQKMIVRHAHIFGDAHCETAEDVVKNWEAIKRGERGQTVPDAMDDVPRSFPALLRAAKVQGKAANEGFDWENAGQALDKVYEEADEVRECLNAQNTQNTHSDKLAEELGDLLFACVNVVRLAKHTPELALNAATDKFARRYARMEALMREEGAAMRGMSLEQMDLYWERVKAAEN